MMSHQATPSTICDDREHEVARRASARLGVRDRIVPRSMDVSMIRISSSGAWPGVRLRSLTARGLPSQRRVEDGDCRHSEEWPQNVMYDVVVT